MKILRPFLFPKNRPHARIPPVLSRLILIVSLAAASSALAAPSFVRDIAPILVEQCVECHRAGKIKGGYRLDAWEVLGKAGDSEAAPLTPGQPEQSELYRLLVTHDEDERMPQKADPLPEAQIKLIRDWIVAGARFDGGEKDGSRPLAALLPEPPPAAAPERYPHPLPVIALAPHPDGEIVAVGGYHEITLWDAGTGKLLRRLSGGLPERVLALQWLERKDAAPLLIAAGGVPGRSGGLWLVDPGEKENGKPPRRLLQTRDCLMRLALTPDGKRVVTAGADNSVHCLALPDGKRLWAVEAHADWVLDLTISPDGRHAATASRDRTARLLNLDDGEIDTTFTAHADPVTSVLFAADGRSVFSGSAGGDIRRWGLDGVAVKDSTLRAGRMEVAAMRQADGLLLAALGDGRLLPLDLEQRKALDPLVTAKDRMETVRVLPHEGGGWKVFAGGHDGVVHRLVLPPPAGERMPPSADSPAASDEKKKTSEKESQDATNEEKAPPPPAPKPIPPLHFTASPGWSQP